MIVVDASVIVEALLATGTGAQTRARLRSAGATLHAPHLIDLEVTQAARRLVVGRVVTPERGRQVIADLAAFPIHRYPHDVLLPRIWELRDILSAYDAAYVVLAEGLGAPLLTHDARLAATRGHRAQVILA